MAVKWVRINETWYEPSVKGSAAPEAVPRRSAGFIGRPGFEGGRESPPPVASGTPQAPGPGTGGVPDPFQVRQNRGGR